MKLGKKKLSLNEGFQNMLKNMGIRKIILLVCCGLLLLVVSMPMGSGASSATDVEGVSGTVSGNAQGSNGYGGGGWGSTDEYGSAMEVRLQNILSQVSGAGRVEVMVTYRESAEDVLADMDNVTEKRVTEQDSSGGQRDTYEYEKEADYVMSEDNKGTPYVTKSISPKPQGVVVLAQGGDDPEVVEKLTRAVESLLDVSVHKIQVLKLN
jgi:stage III sporulation protein AG